MNNVLLGVGSNISPVDNIKSGIAYLEKKLDSFVVSPVYRSPAHGFDGPDFFNLVVSGNTPLGLDELAQVLRQLEFEFGRPDNASKYSSRHLDVDILSFNDYVGPYSGGAVPRKDILRHAFVLKPLVDLQPDFTHPVENRTARDLWQDYLLRFPEQAASLVLETGLWEAAVTSSVRASAR